MRLNKLVLTITTTTAIVAAYAAGWDVELNSSNGILNPGSATPSVPVDINGMQYNAPVTVNVLSLPKVTFLTNNSIPPILVGDGTTYTNGTFTGVYEIKNQGGGALTGFNMVVSGFVQDFGQVVLFKKVVDFETNEVLFTGSWVWSGDSYASGLDGVFLLNQSFSIAPSNHVLVFEVALLHIAGASAPGTSTASLLLVEQDWVPEPASMLALASGLAGLAALRRRKK